MMKKLSLFLMIAVMLLSLGATNAFAALTDDTPGASIEWATTGGQNDADVANANSADELDAVNLETFTLTFTNDNTNNDGGGVDTFAAGAITGTTGDIISTTGRAAAVTTSMSSVTFTGAGDITVTNRDADNVGNATTITGALSTGGAVAVTNNETSANQAISLTIGGTSSVTGAVTVTGNVGAGGGANSTLTLNGATHSAASYSLDNVTGTATLALGASATSISGAIGAITAGDGIITAAGSTTFANQIGTNALYLGNITLSGNAQTVVFSGDVYATDFTQTGTTTAIVNIGANTIDLNGAADGDFALQATGRLAITINSASDFGNILATGGTGSATFVAGNSLAITVAGPIANGATFDIVDATDDAVTAAPGTVTDNSAFLDFTVAERTGANAGDLRVTATLNTTSVATTSNASEVLTSLNSAASTSAGTDLGTVTGALYSLSDSAAGTAALEQLDPDASAAVNNASFTATNQAIGSVVSHMEGARGVSTGDEWLKGIDVWAKGFGTFADQDARKGVNGYDADVWGTTVGFDKMVADMIRAGLSFSYATSDVDAKGSATTLDIDTYQGTLYGTYDAETFYLDGAFSFAWNDYEGARNITFSTINRTANSDYDGQNYSVYFGGGFPIKQENYGMAYTITPLLSLQYSHLEIDKYTETGARDINLIVNDQEYDVLQSGLGAKLSTSTEYESGTLTPEIHARWLYDFIGDEQATTSTFTGGGAAFSTKGADPAQHSLNAGAGLTFATKYNVTLSAVYDLEYKEDYLSHTGQGVIKYSF